MESWLGNYLNRRERRFDAVPLSQGRRGIALAYSQPKLFRQSEDAPDKSVVWKIPLTEQCAAELNAYGPEWFLNFSYPELTLRLLASCEVVKTDCPILSAWWKTQRDEGDAILRNSGESSPYSVAAIADIGYFPFFLSLRSNLRSLSRPVFTYLLCLDSKTRDLALALSDPHLKVVDLAELWSTQELKVVASRSVADRAYSSKARLLAFAMRDSAGPVLYTDLDVYYYGGIEKIIQSLRDSPILLFPQWTDELPLVRKFGLFNAGMVGVNRGAEAFLSWWGDLCLNAYQSNPESGYFVDQGFLDLAPIYFPNLKIYREGDHNVACWNLSTFAIDPNTAADRLTLSGGVPALSFHCVNPDRLRVFTYKHLWDQAASRCENAQAADQSRALRWNILQQQQFHNLAVSRLVFLAGRLRVNGQALSERLVDLLLSFPGRHLLAALAFVHYRLRRNPRQGMGQDPSASRWSDWQRKTWQEFRSHTFKMIPGE